MKDISGIDEFDEARHNGMMLTTDAVPGRNLYFRSFFFAFSVSMDGKIRFTLIPEVHIIMLKLRLFKLEEY